MRPPRALIVPFELGRPLGAPEDPDFQHQVLAATFALLGYQQAGSHLSEFDQEAPEAAINSASLEGWSCPVTFDQSSATASPLQGEIAALQPWYQRAVARRNRTSADTSGLDISQIATLLTEVTAGATHSDDLAGTAESSTNSKLPFGDLVKLAVEDLKLFYAEAAMEQPNPGTSTELQDWFWNQTEAGKLLFQMADNGANHPDKILRTHAKFTLVPAQRLAEHQQAKSA